MLLYGKASLANKCTRKHRLLSLLLLGHILSLASCFVSCGRQTKNGRTHFDNQNKGPLLLVSSPSLGNVNGRPRPKILASSSSSSSTQLYATSFSSGNYYNNNNNNMELGIQIAQLLLSDNDRGYTRLQEQLRSKFPLLPESWIDVMIRTTAQGFKSIAPAKLQLALQPGKMEETVKPELSKALVDLALEQPILQDLPLIQNHDKQQLVEYVVDQILTYVLQQGNIQWILSTPEVRLQSLEHQIQQLHQEMGWKRVWWYRVRQRRHRRAVVVVVALSILVTATAVLATNIQPPNLAILPHSLTSLLLGMKSSAVLILTTIRNLGDVCFQNIIQPFITIVATKFQLG